MRWLALVMLVTGCRNWPAYTGAFDIPAALGVIQPENGAPFDQPIGFVGNQHGGQIAMLALKQGRFLADDGAVAYLRGNQLATGQRRVLSGLFPYVHDDGRVTVFAADRFYRQLVEMPWVVGFTDGIPDEAPTTITDPVASGTASLTDVVIKAGWTPTEDWEVVYDGKAWSVTGSRSGPMHQQAHTGEPFVGVDRAIAFTIQADEEPLAGDRFDFSTDSGAVEHEVGGVPLELTPSPDGTFAGLIVFPDGAQTPVLQLFDPLRPQDVTSATPVDLPGASPTRMAWSADSSRLFVSDSVRPIIWELVWPSTADRSTYTIIRHKAIWPSFDLAHLQGDDDLLYFSRIDGTAYWVLDLETDTLRDLNPWVPGVQGMQMDGAIAGLEAISIPYLQMERSNDGIRRTGRSVAISLASGAIVFAQEGTGCLVDDGNGPRSLVQGTSGITRDYTRDFENVAIAGPFMERSVNSTRHILGNPCAGITREQNWVLRYDETVQGWRVTGSLSEEQESIAYEDQRYVSDDGEVTFTLRSGRSPSQDGWAMSFRMVDGVTIADGDNDAEPNTREVTLDQPGDPLFFHYTVGGDDNGWRPLDDRPFVLVAGEASDRVGRVMPNEGLIDASWD